MSSVMITENRQIVLPEEICEKLGVTIGDEVIFVEKDGEIVLKTSIDLSPAELDDLQQMESLIDQKYSIDTDFEYNMKVYRFDLQEKFILMLNDLYKTDE